MGEQVDVLVVGAGPAGCAAARAAAARGAEVLVIERQPSVGMPVQCAEYVPVQIARYAPLPKRCIAQRVDTMVTYLPDGEQVVTRAKGYVIDRASFDKALAVAAHRAGARFWTGVRATERTVEGVLVRRGGRTLEVKAAVVIGADGPRSTVGRWIGQVNAAYVDARQVEVVLPASREGTEVHFHPFYAGGYGWLFPKGDTANVGVGVSRALGGDPREALEHFLDRLQLGREAIVGRSGGLVPSGGVAERMRAGRVLLAGDAAGHAHPVTGAGIANALIAGTMAGEAAGMAVVEDDLDQLDRYEREWSAYLAGPLRHALAKRKQLDRGWSDDPTALSAAVRETWIAFRGYGRRNAT